MSQNKIINIESLNRSEGLNVSERYKVIKTGDLVQNFIDNGYQVKELKQAKSRKTELVGFTKHLIRLEHPDLVFGVSGLKPQIILKNSYNGTSCFEITMGVFRLVCSNGLVVGTAYESLKVRHVGDVMPKVLNAMQQIQKQTNKIENQIVEMSRVQLSDHQIYEFADTVAKELLPKPKVDAEGNQTSKIANVDPLKLVTINRIEDRGSDLWTVLNRIQENTINGGLTFNTVDLNEGRIRRNRTRGVQAIDRVINLDQLVWDVGTRYLEAKAA